MLGVLMDQAIWAQDIDQGSDMSAGALHFDLPAQSLAQLLLAFRATRLVVVVLSSSLLDGRTSSPVSGNYAPRDALRQALIGTGLQARFLGADSAIIVPLDGDAPAPVPPRPATAIAASAIDGVFAGGDYRAYVSMIQTRLTAALCASPLTRPGDYRLAAQLLIDGEGRISASDIVGSTGSSDRDIAIGRTMRELVLDSAPPVGFPEPVTILLRPLGDGVRVDCPPPHRQG